MRTVTLITACALLLGFSPVASALDTGNFNQNTAIAQIMGIIGKVNLHQADRASMQTFKEFSNWRAHEDASQPTQAPFLQDATAAHNSPASRDRRAF